MHGVPFTQLPQEFVGRNEERVLLEDSPDDNHRVGPHDINDNLPAKLGEIVDSYNRVPIARQDIVQSCLVLNQIIDAGPIFKRPFHVRDQAGPRESLFRSSVEDFLDQSKHPILIEVTIAQISVSTVPQLELTARFRCVHINAR